MFGMYLKLRQVSISQNLPENQSVFLRGFCVARTLRILLKHLKAAAEPPPDADGDDDEPYMELVLLPNVTKVKHSVQPILALI